MRPMMMLLVALLVSLLPLAGVGTAQITFAEPGTSRPSTGPNRELSPEQKRKIFEDVMKEPEPFIDEKTEAALATTVISEDDAAKLKQSLIREFNLLVKYDNGKDRKGAIEVKELEIDKVPPWREGVLIQVKEGMLYLPYRSRRAVFAFPVGTEIRGPQWSWDSLKPGIAPPDQVYAIKVGIADGGTTGTVLEMTRQAIITRLTLDESGDLAANARVRYVRSDETVDLGFMNNEPGSKRHSPRVNDDLEYLSRSMRLHQKLDIRPAIVRAWKKLDAMTDLELQLAIAAANPDSVRNAPDLESMIVQYYLFLGDLNKRSFAYRWKSGDNTFLFSRQPGPRYVGETLLVFFKFGANGNIQKWGTLTTTQPLNDEEALQRVRWFEPVVPSDKP